VEGSFLNYKILQVGSHVGTHNNNKYVLDMLKESDLCIFAEPVPSLFEILVNNFKIKYPRNNFIYVNKACSNFVGKIGLYVPDILPFTPETQKDYIQKGLTQWVDQLSSVLPNHVKDHHFPQLTSSKVEVPCTTLDSLIQEYNIKEIEHLVIDTEGHDFEVLEGLDLYNVKPKTIHFEHKHMAGSNKPFGEKYDKIIARFDLYGYKIVFQDTEDTRISLL
jgi:FkbM family methyltransferase